VGVELVGLVDVAHHDLGFSSVGQKRNAAGFFDLVDDPVPVADGLEGDGRAFGELGEEGLDFARGVTDPNALNEFSSFVQNCKEREVLVGIAADRII
jgi:hypothetical protein